MPSVNLSDYECRRDLLPPVCMFCGQPATTRVRRTFSWYPGWVLILILVNLIVMLVVALILTKKMTVRVPTCDRHEGYWRRRTIIVSLTGLVVGAVCVGAIIYSLSAPPGGDEVTGWLCGSGFVLFLLWLIAAGIYSAGGVRPGEITDRTIRLAGVHDDFLAALREERARYREEGGPRRGRYGDERDDYDEMPDDEPPPAGRRPRDDRDYDDRDDDRRPRRRDDRE